MSFQIDRTVRLLCTDFIGTVKAVYPNYEESGQTAYAVEMPPEAIRVGMLPIEVVSESLLLPSNGRQTEPNYLASRFAWEIQKLIEGQPQQEGG